MQETGRTYDLTIAGTLHINHLGRLGAKQYNKTVLLTVLLSRNRNTKQDCCKNVYQSLQKVHRLLGLADLRRPCLTAESTILEKRIYDDVCLTDLGINEIINRFLSELHLCIFQKKIIIVGE